MKLFDVYPLLPVNIVRAEGAYVWDDRDNRYLDMYGGHAVISIGHNHPRWVERITAQLRKIAFYSNSVINTLQQELAERLGIMSGRPDYNLFLCNSGAEANENALKLASFYTGRKKIVAFTGAFHGRTSLAVSATDNRSYTAPVNETGNVVFLPFNDVGALQEYFGRHGREVAAVITEGIQGVGGIRIASGDFLAAIRELCDTYGAVFVADSVQCGYGRSGRFYSHDHGNVAADIYTMAKGMGNGFPVAGISIAPHIPARHGMLGTTFGGSHLACTAGIAVLEVMETEGLAGNAMEMGAYLTAQLQDIKEIENVRGRGLMIGFDVPGALAPLKRHLLEHYRILTGEAAPNVIRLLPGLALSREEASVFVQALRSAVNDLTR